jgi:transposase
MPATLAIGVDEIAVRKGYEYRVAVSGLKCQRPIWFGDSVRKQENLENILAAYGEWRCAEIQVAVMDTWKPFHEAICAQALQSEIAFDPERVPG